MLHQLTPVLAPNARIETRLDFVGREPVKFGEKLVTV
jgi:hypothetical protein